MARIYTFKGKTHEQLAAMQASDFVNLLDSRQRRSIKRNGLAYKSILKKISEAKASASTKMIKTHAREAIIMPDWVGLTFGVHNGKEFKEVKITEEMMGHRLGEFSFSTKRVLHSAPGIRATRGSKFLSVK
jgi:small subunit ribosomal protein S19